MTPKGRNTLSKPYAYRINTVCEGGIDTVSIYKRQETRDKETSDGIKATARKQQGSFALEGVKASRSRSKKRNGQKPKASKVDFSKGVHVFTDGACEPNPGPGGWAFVVYENGYAVHSESGSVLATTNNRMELQAVEAALDWMQHNTPSNAHIHTDSQYCSKGANEWRHGWKRKDWKRGDYLIPNADLWQRIDAALEVLPVSLNWVRGHSGITGNEAADRLAVSALKHGLQERRGAA